MLYISGVANQNSNEYQIIRIGVAPERIQCIVLINCTLIARRTVFRFVHMNILTPIFNTCQQKGNVFVFNNETKEKSSNTHIFVTNSALDSSTTTPKGVRLHCWENGQEQPAFFFGIIRRKASICNNNSQSIAACISFRQNGNYL